MVPAWLWLTASSARLCSASERALIAAVTPVEKEEVRVRCFTQPRQQATPIAAMMAQGFIHEVCRQLDQDKVIWDHQKYMPRPVICGGDGPILRFRQYYQQFYVE